VLKPVNLLPSISAFQFKQTLLITQYILRINNKGMRSRRRALSVRAKATDVAQVPNLSELAKVKKIKINISFSKGPHHLPPVGGATSATVEVTQ
jgi:hypothetical protein